MSAQNWQTSHTQPEVGAERLFDIEELQGGFTINPECERLYNELKIRRKHRFLIFKIGKEDIRSVEIGAREKTHMDLIRLLPETECRYCVYDQEYTTNDGRKASKLWFISWFPVNSNGHQKMAYTTAKNKFCESLKGVFDLEAQSTEEVVAGLGFGDDDASDDGSDF